MTKVSIEFATDLPRVLQGRTVDISIDNLFETLAVLGEDPESSDGNPIVVKFQLFEVMLGYIAANVHGTASEKNGKRQANVSLVDGSRRLRHSFGFGGPEFKMRPVELVNRNLVHELRHVVDYADEELMAQQGAFRAERGAEVEAYLPTDLSLPKFYWRLYGGGYDRLRQRRDFEVKHNSPLEVRAYRDMELFTEGKVPSILSIE